MNNKETGSYYTPDSLIQKMVKYVHDRIVPQKILEPSAGDGRFVPYLHFFDCPITLIEIEENKANELQKQHSMECTVLCKDFISYALENDEDFDLIIGNPPYISKKILTKEQRDISLDMVNYFHLPESLFQNIWISFILASLKVLSPNGTLFFVLPFEFLQVQYAEGLREFLETKFNTIEITTFEDRVFPEIEQDVCLVYLSNEPEAKPYIQYTTVVSDSNFEPVFQSVIMRNKPLKKWSNCILDDNETEKLNELAMLFPKIDSFGDISPGIVTGANSFFIVTKEKKESFEMDGDAFIPIVSKSSGLNQMLILNCTEFEALTKKDLPTYLLILTGIAEETFSSNLLLHLHEGKELSIPRRYKCSKRKRWYDVPIVKNGQVCFFKRFSVMPRLLVNDVNVHTTDIAYNIRFSDGFDPPSFAFCFYNSLTLAMCEYNGRFYGGGVGELVPSEFKQLRIPYKKIEESQIAQLDEMFRENRDVNEIVDFVDSIVFDVSADNLILLKNIRSRYIRRRLRLYKREEQLNG